jgi:hypothetical protein
MSVDKWILGLKRLNLPSDLPVTLQGGEPTTYPYFYTLVSELHNAGVKLDLLTNGLFDDHKFILKLKPEYFRTGAKYASIRFSLHRNTNVHRLFRIVATLRDAGYDVGVWGLKHPANKKLNSDAQILAELYSIDFRLKEFLGQERDVNWKEKIYGTYKYPKGVFKTTCSKVLCESSELLLDPSGYIHRCHHHLYSNSPTQKHILDKTITFDQAYPCWNFGQCNPCDLKLKTDRFQEGGHCSVKIGRCK